MVGTILIVEDDDGDRDRMVEFLREAGHTVHAAPGADEALVIYDRLLGQVDVIVLDLSLDYGKEGGVNLIEAIRKRVLHPFPPRLIVRSAISDARNEQYDRLRYHDSIEKLDTSDEGYRDLCVRVGKQVEILKGNLKFGSGVNLEPFRDEFRTPYLGDETFRLEMMNFAKSIRDQDVILIVGPTGAGKGLLARFLHEHSGHKPKEQEHGQRGHGRRENVERFRKEFVHIPMNALYGANLPSELFGHKKGAFTGADRDKEGMLLAGDEGTIFFDEIGRLKDEYRENLLAFLETGNFVPMSGDPVKDKKHVNALIILGSQNPLPHDSGVNDAIKGRARTITLKPLRERSAEIPGLMDYLRRAYYQACRVEVYPDFSEEVVTEFRQAQWRYNLRSFIKILSMTLENSWDRNGGVAKKITHEHIPREFFDEVRIDEEPGDPKKQGQGLEPILVPEHRVPRINQLNLDDQDLIALLHPNFSLSNPPLRYGIYDRASAILLLRTLKQCELLRTLKQCEGVKAEAARRLGIRIEHMNRAIQKYFSKDEQRRYYSPKNSGDEPPEEFDDDGMTE